MPYSWKHCQFQAKAEGVEGTAETLADADANIQILVDPSIDPVIPYFQRGALRALTGDFPGIAGGPRHVGFTVRVPIFGSGTAGTPPAMGLLFRAAGMGVANVPATSDTYTPSTTYTHITSAININGYLVKIHGALVRAFTLNLNNGEGISADFEIEGALNTPAAEAAKAPTYETPNQVPIIGATFTLDSVAFKAKTFSIRYENELEPREDRTKSSGIFSMHGAPATPHVTGQMQVEMEAPGTYDFFTKYLSNATYALVHGPIGGTAGNKVTVSAPAVQYSDAPKFGKKGHTLAGDLSLLFCGSSGDDAVSIAFT